ncbi:MAG: glutamate mutase [Dictyoglomus sp. NZ13-RE01]|nr:MAG: glutamate mutase [Dictyoglomus sp. NZ13-RE01]
MLGLFFDLGSTFTKVSAFDLDKCELIAKAKAPSTANIDITIGLNNALSEVFKQTGKKIEDFDVRRATSSAKGGLRIVAVGLVPDLTAEAAKRASLGAGAKVIKTYSYELSESDLDEIYRLKPDLIVLAGGTDGGNKYYPLINAKKLSSLDLDIPVIYAGNKDVADEVHRIFEKAKKEIYITENVMPEFGVLNITPVQSKIREIFLERLIISKGLDKAKKFVDSIVMPTPLAVLKACEKFSSLNGETMLVDVGGATTDVCSVASGKPTQSFVILKGLPEPYVKRTVEGDLGVRVSAYSLWEAVSEEVWKNLLGNLNSYREKVKFLSENTDFIPTKEEDIYFDHVLASVAIDIAVRRHVGHIEVVYSPMGSLYFQYGKDLTDVRALIGTGGPLIYNPYNLKSISFALFNPNEPFVLKPKNPDIFIDKEYILYAIGLISEIFPEKSDKLISKYIVRVSKEERSNDIKK